MVIRCALDCGYEELIPPSQCWYGIDNKVKKCSECKNYRAEFCYDDLGYDEREMLKYCVEHMYDCDLSEWSIEDKKIMLRLCRIFDIDRESLGWNSDDIKK